MKIKSLTTFILGIIIVIIGAFFLQSDTIAGLIPVLIGASLIYLGWRGGRAAAMIFGHCLIVIGCYLIAWGIYLLPYSQPIPTHIFSRPLFWGLITLFGGICANFHGFCNCILKKENIKK